MLLAESFMMKVSDLILVQERENVAGRQLHDESERLDPVV